MNWTAILALSVVLVVILVQYFALRDANERASQAWARVDEHAKRESDALNQAGDYAVELERVKSDLADAERRARRRSRRSDRAQGNPRPETEG